MRRAQFRGRQNMLIQALLTAAVFNIKQLVRRRPLPQSGMATKPLLDLAACFHSLLRRLWKHAVPLNKQPCQILVAGQGYGAWMDVAASG